MLARRYDTPGSETKDFITHSKCSSQCQRDVHPSCPQRSQGNNACVSRWALNMQRIITGEEVRAWMFHLFFSKLRQVCSLSRASRYLLSQGCSPPMQPWVMAWVKSSQAPAFMAYTGRTFRDAQGPSQNASSDTNQIRFPFPWKGKRKVRRIEKCYSNTSPSWG